MKDEWVTNWTEAIGSYLLFPGLASTSRDPGVAIYEFIGTLTDEDLKNHKEPFLWVFTVCSTAAIFSLDSPDYSAYPQEREVLLREGKEVWVLGREKVFTSRLDMSFNVFYCLIK